MKKELLFYIVGFLVGAWFIKPTF